MKRIGNWTGKHTRQITKEEMKEYGSRFKQLRESVGLSKSKLGRELGGVNQATIRRWEEECVVPQRNIKELAEEIEFIVDFYKNKSA